MIYLVCSGYSETSHWSDVTTGEIGSMIMEAAKRGEDAMVQKEQATNNVTNQ
ncbi:MAG: hypothetical protein H6Q70_2789 [Firmicutes bacterium]|nr:hypothetical protein [Bacillota bacterium]